MDHGLLNNGFDIDVNKLEKADGVGGSVSIDRPKWDITLGTYATVVSNLEYVDNDSTLPRPILRNDTNQLTFFDVDAQASLLPWTWLKVGLGVEHVQIPDQYKAVEPVAAVETDITGLPK